MTCKWCHEFCPPNRKDGFCSDLCKEWNDKAITSAETKRDMKPIPIGAAKRIAEEYGYDQVIVIARKVGKAEHVTTYGADPQNCAAASRIGHFLKFKVMGWVKEDVTDHEATAQQRQASGEQGG